MKSYLIVLSLTILVGALCQTEFANPFLKRSASPKAGGLRLDGGFIEYQNAMMPWNWQWATKPYPISWNDLLATMRHSTPGGTPTGLGMDTIIIKRLATAKEDLAIPNEGENADWEFFQIDNSTPANPKDTGPTEAILKYADENGLNVYIGLWEDKTFSYSKINQNYLDIAAKKSINLSKRLWPLYRQHRSFSGWYFPNEFWNMRATDTVKANLLNKFIKDTSHFCLEELGKNDQKWGASSRAKRIAIAPYFDPDINDIHSPADEVKDFYRIVLTNSGVTTLVLQDRVGIVGWNVAKDYLDDYFAAFKSVCDGQTPKIDFWAAVEIFQQGPKHAEPYDGSSLFDQLRSEGKYTSKAVAFDYYHYMNPVVPDAGEANEPVIIGSLERRKKLFRFYEESIRDKKMSLGK